MELVLKAAVSDGDDDDSAIHAALLKACVDLGYDEDHEARLQLVAKLALVVQSGRLLTDVATNEAGTFATLDATTCRGRCGGLRWDLEVEAGDQKGGGGG